MADTNPTPEKVEAPVQSTEVTETVTPPASDEPFDKDRAMATIHNLREIEKQAKKDARELEQLRAEKAKRDEAEMTELQKFQKAANEREAENAKLKADILRRDVIAETGLPAIFADRLKGMTKEEMLADAQELAKTLPTVKMAPKLPATEPANASTKETEAQRYERLFGVQGQNLFDPDRLKERGGGVVVKGVK